MVPCLYIMNSLIQVILQSNCFSCTTCMVQKTNKKNKQTILWLAVASYDFSESEERGNKACRCTSQSKSQSHCLKAKNELGSTNNPLPRNTFELFFVIKVTQDGQILYNSQKSHQPQSSFYALYPAPLKELQFDGAGHSLPLLSSYLWIS